MCLLIVDYQRVPKAPLLLAANREESFDRPTEPPAIRRQDPRGGAAVLCGIDLRAGGTWLGVNEHGVVVAVTNRPVPGPAANGRSRGALCRELLDCVTAGEAVGQAMAELERGHYAGANLLCADASKGWVIHGGGRRELISLTPGLHLMTNGDLDDPHDARLVLARQLLARRSIDSVSDFVDAARQVCSYPPASPTTPYAVGGPSIVLRGAGRGTVSSTIICLADRAAESKYLFAAGPPDVTAYDDYSDLLIRMVTQRRQPGGESPEPDPKASDR